MLLSGEGFESIHVGDVDLLTATDQAILDYATANGLVIISADSDFGELRPPASRALAAPMPPIRAPGGPDCTVRTGDSVHEPVHADQGDHRMPATERCRPPADRRMLGSGRMSPPAESPMLLTAEPLDLDY